MRTYCKSTNYMISPYQQENKDSAKICMNTKPTSELHALMPNHVFLLESSSVSYDLEYFELDLIETGEVLFLVIIFIVSPASKLVISKRKYRPVFGLSRQYRPRDFTIGAFRFRYRFIFVCRLWRTFRWII